MTASDFVTGNPHPHGYTILGMAAATFEPGATASLQADQATGMWPGPPLPLRVIDLRNSLAGSALQDRIVQVIGAMPGDVVLNTSFADGCAPTGCTASGIERDARQWIARVRLSGLEDRFLHVSAAGNIYPNLQSDTDATLGSTFNAAARRPLPGGVSNLRNTIVVENTTSSDPARRPAASRLPDRDLEDRRPDLRGRQRHPLARRPGHGPPAGRGRHLERRAAGRRSGGDALGARPRGHAGRADRPVDDDGPRDRRRHRGRPALRDHGSPPPAWTSMRPSSPPTAPRALLRARRSSTPTATATSTSRTSRRSATPSSRPTRTAASTSTTVATTSTATATPAAAAARMDLDATAPGRRGHSAPPARSSASRSPTTRRTCATSTSSATRPTALATTATRRSATSSPRSTACHRWTSRPTRRSRRRSPPAPAARCASARAAPTAPAPRRSPESCSTTP